MAATILEAVMILLFGISWPFNVIKSWRTRTAKGKSLLFLMFIFIGYICGILSKLILAYNGNFFITWLHYLLFCFYFINILMVAADIVLYFRNKKIDSLLLSDSKKGE